jgi:hypothetical protein
VVYNWSQIVTGSFDAPKSGAKIQKIFDICKLFLHIARNQHEIAENKYKEDKKTATRVALFNLVHSCAKSIFLCLLSPNDLSVCLLCGGYGQFLVY